LGGVYLLPLVCLLWQFGGFRPDGKCRRGHSGWAIAVQEEGEVLWRVLHPVGQVDQSY